MARLSKAIHQDNRAYIDPAQVKERLCLKCRVAFISYSAGNRICGKCRQANNQLDPGKVLCEPHDSGRVIRKTPGSSQHY